MYNKDEEVRVVLGGHSEFIDPNSSLFSKRDQHLLILTSHINWMEQKIKIKKQIYNQPPQEHHLSKELWIGTQVKYNAERWKELRELSVKSSKLSVNPLTKT